MQELVDSRVSSESNGLLHAVADRHCISILQAVDKEPKTVSQISSERSINPGILYRRMKILQKNGLLDSFYKIRPDGKKFFLYKSLVKDIAISFSDNKLEVNITLKRDGTRGPSLDDLSGT